MSCIIFTPAKNIFKCTETIEVGNIGLNNTAVLVYFQRIQSNYIVKEEAISDGSGVLTVTVTDKNYLSPNFKYNVWVSPLNATSPEDFLPVTIDTVEYEGFIFGVERTESEDSKIVIDCLC